MPTKNSVVCEWCLRTLANIRAKMIRCKDSEGGEVTLWVALCKECWGSKELINLLGDYHYIKEEKKNDKFCTKGHALVTDNVYECSGRKYCRICRNQRMKIWRLANKEKARKQTREAVARFYKRNKHD